MSSVSMNRLNQSACSYKALKRPDICSLAIQLVAAGNADCLVPRSATRSMLGPYAAPSCSGSRLLLGSCRISGLACSALLLTH